MITEEVEDHSCFFWAPVLADINSTIYLPSVGSTTEGEEQNHQISAHSKRNHGNVMFRQTRAHEKNVETVTVLPPTSTLRIHKQRF